MKKNNYWFKAKDYGYGWTPKTWEGWVVTIAGIAAILISVTALEAQPEWALATVLIEVFMLIIVCIVKGEKPEWRWGGKKIKWPKIKK
ncbi:MAG: hypothetical protein ACOZAO_05070 [Patescibacteria group bacterium]